MGAPIFLPLCVLRLFLCVCETSVQITNKKPQHVSNLSKLDTLLQKNMQQGPSDTKIASLGMSRFIILSKITHQMWLDHAFSQRNKVTERAARLGVGENLNIF